MRRTVLYPALIVLALLVGYLTYALVRTASELSDARQQQAQEHRTVLLLRDLLADASSGRTRHDIEAMAAKYSLTHIVKRGEHEISLDDLVFTFDGDRLLRVRLMNENE